MRAEAKCVLTLLGCYGLESAWHIVGTQLLFFWLNSWMDGNIFRLILHYEGDEISTSRTGFLMRACWGDRGHFPDDLNRLTFAAGVLLFSP